MSDTKSALRAHLKSHNRSVLTASALALFFSALGWAILYGASYWATMMALTVAHNGDCTMPLQFNAIFFGSAAALMLLARFGQWLFPHERAPDERPKLEHLLDVALFVPRFTMSIWQNLGALAHLSRAESADAACLLDRLKSANHVAVQDLPADFPHARRLQRMLDALLVTGLLDLRSKDDVIWLYVGALAPEVFRAGANKLPQTEDPLASVPPVKIRERTRLLRQFEARGEK